MEHAGVRRVLGDWDDYPFWVPCALNRHDVVVGDASATRSGAFTALDTLLADALGWRIARATGTNDRGQSAGLGVRDGTLNAVRLDPLASTDSP